MISGMIFRPGRSRRPSALVPLTPGKAITISTDAVLMVTVCPETDRFDFIVGWTDGRQFDYSTTPSESSLDLTVYVGFLVIPRAVRFNRRGLVDRVIAEFVKTADFAPDIPGISIAQHEVAKP